MEPINQNKILSHNYITGLRQLRDTSQSLIHKGLNIVTYRHWNINVCKVWFVLFYKRKHLKKEKKMIFFFIAKFLFSDFLKKNVDTFKK